MSLQTCAVDIFSAGCIFYYLLSTIATVECPYRLVQWISSQLVVSSTIYCQLYQLLNVLTDLCSGYLLSWLYLLLCTVDYSNCWMSLQTCAVDIFSAGCIFYYLLLTIATVECPYRLVQWISSQLVVSSTIYCRLKQLLNVLTDLCSRHLLSWLYLLLSTVDYSNCWMSLQTCAVDIFSAGCIFYYLLSTIATVECPYRLVQ